MNHPLSIEPFLFETSQSTFPYCQMCFSGGSSQGICFVGGLFALDHHFPEWQSQIHSYIGSSFGGLLATILCLDWKPREIMEWLIRTPFDSLISLHEWTTIDFFGMDNGTKLMTFLSDRFRDKGWSPQLTFEDLYMTTGRTLRMTGTSVTTGKTLWFDHIQTPHLCILDAVRMTISVPFLFSAVPYNDDWIVDGALTNFYPIDGVDDLLTLGFCLDVSYRTSTLPFTSFDTYLFAILETMLHRYQPSQFPPNTKTVWFSNLPPVHIAQFDISIQQKKELLEHGYKCIDDD